MFDKRLFKELKIIKAFWIKVALTAFVIVTLTILQGQKLAWIINAFIIDKMTFGQIKGSLVVLIIIVVSKYGMTFAYEYYHRLCGIKIKGNIRSRLLESIIELGPIKLKDEKAGALTSVIQAGVEELEPFYSEFIPQMLLVMSSTPLVFAVVMYVDWISGLIMFLTLPFIPVFMMLIGKMSSQVSKQQWKKLQQMNAHFLDVLRGLATLRLFERVKRQARIIYEVNESFRAGTMKVLRVAFLSALVLELTATLSTALVAVSLGMRLIYGKIEFYDAFFILLMAPDFYQPIRQLGAKFHAAMGSKAAAESVYSYIENIDLQTTISSKTNGVLETKIDSKINNAKATKKQTKISQTKEYLNVKELIKIDQLSFSYAKDVEVLRNINLVIPNKQKIAIVGPSGSGKSTLISALLGFVDVNKGEISLNQINKKAFTKEEWGSYFAYVPQKPHLFKASLWDNLVMSNPSISVEKVDSVMKKIGLRPWFEQLSAGYETMIGQGALTLSGGQMQLIAIGRALLKEARILVLDEPTSALDSITEKQINIIINDTLKDYSVLVIAHRIPTILSADYIYYLDHGQIVEEGRHDALMKQGKHYYQTLTSWGGGL